MDSKANKLKSLVKSKKTTYILMTLLVFFWGMEYIAAKTALELIQPLSLVFIKYTIGLACLVISKIVVDRRMPFRLKDVPIVLLCSLFGDVLYFGSEYTAMDYLPVSVITIILAFVPCVSLLIEAVIYKKLPTVPILVGVFVCVLGVAMVIGADFKELLNGKYLGYLLAFGAVVCWNIYNFVTKGLSEKYKPLDLTIFQQICAIALVLPYAITHLPAKELITSEVVTGIMYLGMVSAFLGFLIYIHGIDILGPTPCALFSNFMPVTTTFFGWIFLGEMVSTIQMIGGIVVIASGAFVIWKEGQLDDLKKHKGVGNSEPKKIHESNNKE